MATLTKKQRDALPDADFGYISGSGDSAIRLFPITDQEDVDSAARLIGKSPEPDATKKRILAIAERKSLTAPKAWAADDAQHSAATPDSAAALFAADETLVLRVGKAFAAGDYPDKAFNLSPAEMLDAIRNRETAPLDFGHPLVGSPLDGKLGDVIDCWAGENESDLEVAVAMPKWLDDMLPADGRKVSAVWSRGTKRLKALSFVSDPRVSDAALMAAFASRHDTHEGQAAIQQMHDTAARAGAVCKQANASMSSAHEMSALQTMHDTATQHGARCNAMGSGSPLALYSAEAPTIIADRRGGNLMSWLQTFRDKISKLPDDAAPEAVFAAFSGDPAQTASQSHVAATPVVDTEKDTLRAELARERAKGITRDAASFADRIIEIEHRAFPAEREAIVSAYTQAASDDIAYPGTVTFANGQSGSRLAVLAATYAARPAHQLTMEQLGPEMHALFNRQVTDNPNDPNRKPSREEKDALLAMTPLGQTHLRERSRNGSN